MLKSNGTRRQLLNCVRSVEMHDLHQLSQAQGQRGRKWSGVLRANTIRWANREAFIFTRVWRRNTHIMNPNVASCALKPFEDSPFNFISYI